MSFDLKVLHDRIVVKSFPAKEVTAGGLIIPDTAKERPSKATVMAVGNGTKDKEMYLKPGFVVFHVKGAGIEIEYKGEAFYIMSDKDVLTYLEN